MSLLWKQREGTSVFETKRVGCCRLYYYSANICSFLPTWDLNAIDPHHCLVWSFDHMIYYEQWYVGETNSVSVPKEGSKRHRKFQPAFLYSRSPHNNSARWREATLTLVLWMRRHMKQTKTSREATATLQNFEWEKKRSICSSNQLRFKCFSTQY